MAGAAAAFGAKPARGAASADSTAAAMTRAANPVNFNMGTLVGSYANVAKMLDELSTVPGVRGVMMTFDDFVIGMEQFGTRIMPLMRCRDSIKLAA